MALMTKHIGIKRLQWFWWEQDKSMLSMQHTTGDTEKCLFSLRHVDGCGVSAEYKQQG